MELTTGYLVFVACGGLFGIFVGLKNRRSEESLLNQKAFLRGCVTFIISLIVLDLFTAGVIGRWTAIAAIGGLLILQEYVIAARDKLHAQKGVPCVSESDKARVAEIEQQERWQQIRKRGLRHFVLTTTARYALAGVVLIGFARVFSPTKLPLYVWIVIIFAYAVGGATLAIRQWSWSQRKDMPSGLN